MSRRLRLVAALALSLVLVGPVAAQAAPDPVQRRAAAPTGQVQLIQGVPGVRASVSVDGDEVGSGLGVGSVRAVDLAPGAHEVRFEQADGASAVATVQVVRGRSSDVVFHLPAALGGEPVVSTYRTPTRAIGPGKARVLVAHTATLAPADVVVDGQTIFNDIANGEFAEAEVPAGSLSVALVASGGTGDPVFGPIDVRLKPSTVTMVYAVGRPEDGTMEIITRSDRVASDGTSVPEAIDTGSAGLAADVRVAPFAPSGAAAGTQTGPVGSDPWGWVALTGALLALLAAAGSARAGRLPSPR